MIVAETYAAKHGIKMNHTVAIRRGEEIVKLVHEHHTDEILDFDDPPF